MDGACEMPRLVVLVPAYNAESTLGAALSSTLRALPRDSAIMVLDDGSIDATAGIARALEDPRIRVHSRPNGGVASALNELLRRTDSEFIARMDADDLVLPGRFTRQLRAMTGGVDAVFTTVVQWGTGLRGVPRPSEIDPMEFGLHLLLTNPVAHSTLLARRAAIEVAGGYRELPTEDYDLWLRMAAGGARLRRLPIPGLAYRVHPGQITASAQWRRSSWLDPRIAAAYTALAQQLLGIPAQRITSLSVDDSLDPGEKWKSFAQFREKFEQAIEGRPAPARRALGRRLREREKWLEARLGEQSLQESR